MRTCLLLTAAALLFSTGCNVTPPIKVDGSGNIKSMDMEFTDFDSVSVSNQFNVRIVQADAFSVQLNVDENIVEHLDVQQNGSELLIQLKPGWYQLNQVQLDATVEIPRLAKASASGASTITFSEILNDSRMEADASGASLLQGYLVTPILDIELSGASTAELDGMVEDLKVDASGASTGKLSTLSAITADVDASGASNIHVNVAEKLTGDASGASTVKYGGEVQTVSVDTSGASSVKRE